MKTIGKIFIVVSLIVLTSFNIARSEGPFPISVNNEITYTVTIVTSITRVRNTNIPVYIAVTDQNNHLVAPAQQVVPGMFTYTFNEIGPVKGTRTAYLLFEPKTRTNFYIYCPPESEEGIFMPGQTYGFDLYPQVLQNIAISVNP
jgi:hypothetical protein